MKHGIKVGDHILCDHSFSEREYQRLDYNTKDFICPDKYVYAKVHKGKVYPLGRRFLIRRDTSERVGTIVEAAEAQLSTDQSLEGVVETIGILPRVKKTRKTKPVVWKINGINIGDRIRLKAWREDMIEINVRDIFYLIVDEADILFKYE